MVVAVEKDWRFGFFFFSSCCGLVVVVVVVVVVVMAVVVAVAEADGRGGCDWFFWMVGFIILL